MIRIDEQVKNMCEKVDDIHKVLHGNGQEGICSKVTKNETKILNLCKKHEKDSKFRLTVIGLGFTAITIVIMVTNYLW